MARQLIVFVLFYVKTLRNNMRHTIKKVFHQNPTLTPNVVRHFKPMRALPLKAIAQHKAKIDAI